MILKTADSYTSIAHGLSDLSYGSISSILYRQTFTVGEDFTFPLRLSTITFTLIYKLTLALY